MATIGAPGLRVHLGLMKDNGVLMMCAPGSNELDWLEGVRGFVAKEVLPYTRDWESACAFDDGIWTKLGSQGLLSVCLGVEHGGLGYSCGTYCEAIRELAKGDPALAMNVAAINALCVGHIAEFGTAEQREKYLPGIVSGETKLAWGLTEPDAGSDARRVRTKAAPIDGKAGYYAINGEKMFITNGGKADLIIMVARTSDTELSAFLMETNQPGFTLEERIHTVGVSASNTVRFKLKDAVAWHTPCSFEQAISLLYRGRLGIAAMAVGIAEKAHELAVGSDLETLLQVLLEGVGGPFHVVLEDVAHRPQHHALVRVGGVDGGARAASAASDQTDFERVRSLGKDSGGQKDGGRGGGRRREEVATRKTRLT